MNEIYVSLDLEMTSARPENQEVIEIAAIRFRGDRALETWSRLIRPKGPVPYNVQVLTGIKPADLARAPALGEVAESFVAFVGRSPLVAHSVGSDVGCLQRQGVVLANPQIDTFELAAVLLPQLPSYSLAALAERFGIPFKNQHRALADAHATKSLFLKLVERIRELDITILQEIVRLVDPFDWPLKSIFRQVEAERPRPSAFGASIRQQLAAKNEDDDLPLEVLLLAPPDQDPPRPSGEPTPSPESVAAPLAAEGGVARGLAGFEVRSAQIEMSQAVATAFEAGDRLLVEAPVGTGRTLAYLVPAVELAVRQGEPVVVAVSSYQLREQIWDRDLPLLQQVLPTPFRSALLKPRDSYLCLSRWSALRHRRDLSLAAALVLVKTLVWLPETRTGDVAELNLIDAEREVWTGICADESCEPESCEYSRRGACFLGRALAQAGAAQVVLTSHSVLLSDIVSPRPLLPAYRYLVVDEAHRLEEEATLALANHLTSSELLAQLAALADSPGLPSELTSRLQGGDGRRAASLPASRRHDVESGGLDVAAKASAARQAAGAFFDSLAPVFRDGSAENRGFEQRLRLTKSVRGRPGWTRSAALAGEAATALQALQAALDSLLSTLEGISLRDGQALLGELQTCMSRAESGAGLLTETASSPDPTRVYWLSLGESELGVHSAPIQVGPTVADGIFSACESVSLVSSTLAIGGSFEHVKSRLGLAETRELVLEPPSRAIEGRRLYLPTDLPEPEQPAYQAAVTRALGDLCLATGGRTLVLFTSHSQLRQTWKAIQERLAKAGILALGQGIDGSPRRQLVQTFRTNPRTVLLATGSFWEHLEVAEDSVRVLVVPRLPFGQTSDPVVAARSEGVRDPLAELSLPQMVLRLRQAFDRLASARPDRSAVVLLDRRLLTKSYGPGILDSLPHGETWSGPVAALPEAIADWLGGSRPAAPRTTASE